MTEQLVQLCYAKWTGYYSAKNWVKHWPLWEELGEEDKKWWTDFVTGVRTGFKSEDVEKKKVNN